MDSNKEKRISAAKQTISDEMIKTIFQHMVATHTDAMIQLVGKEFVIDDHVWTIERGGCAWAVNRKGLFDWSMDFHMEESFDGCIESKITNFRVNRNPLIDTAAHFKSAMAFVAEFISTYDVDGNRYPN